MKFFKDVRDLDQAEYIEKQWHFQVFCPMSDKLCKPSCVNYYPSRKIKFLWWFILITGGCKYFKRCGARAWFDRA